MMAYTAVTFNPLIWKYGAAEIVDNTYKGGGTAWSAGDPLRVTNAGLLKPCAADENASVNAIALRMESNEKTRFMSMIIIMMLVTDVFFTLLPGSASSAIICQISFIDV